MDQCRDWRWTSHCIRKPCVKRYLGTFTGGANQKQQSNQSDYRCAYLHSASLRKYLGKRNGLKCEKKQDNSKNKSKVANAVHHKCFPCCVVVCRILEPESNEQVGAETHAFPTNK